MSGKKVVIIGGGAAGCMAAVFAARQGAEVIVLESTPRLMNKVRITGKGRCNVTNACDAPSFYAHVVRNPRFLKSVYTAFDNRALMDFFERLGVPLKTERGQRVFPQSDRAHDIADALAKEMEKCGVRVLYKTKAQALNMENGRVKAVQACGGRPFALDACIVATGGRSYPVTGSTGDGYRLARQAGHTVVPTQPSLCPVITEETWVADLAGLSLKNVGLKAEVNGKKVFYDQGEMLFTHKGVSGPLVLSASAHLERDAWPQSALILDWKPALTEEQVNARLLREIQFAPNREVKTMMIQLVPKNAAPLLPFLAGIDPALPCNALTKQQRRKLTEQLKHTRLSVRAAGPMEEAIVTRGGVNVKEIQPKSMQSKRAENLFFAGEVLDLDAYTGGYNLQIAFSTGVAAGLAAAE